MSGSIKEHSGKGRAGKAHAGKGHPIEAHPARLAMGQEPYNRDPFSKDPFGNPQWESPPRQATPPVQLVGLAERLTRTLAVSKALLQAGRPLDLSGFNDGVGLLCAQTLDLDPEEYPAMLSILRDLRGLIDSLAEIFERRLGEMAPREPQS